MQPSAVWTAYIDGSAHPNPGRMSIGGVLHAPNHHLHTFSAPLANTGCNNEAEARAAAYALQWLHTLGATHVLLYTDSSILAEQLMHPSPKPIARLHPLYSAVRAQLTDFDAVVVRWIPRHKNAVADALARAAFPSATTATAAAHTPTLKTTPTTAAPASPAQCMKASAA